MNRRERKKQETRRKIIDCAMELFREKGFQETSMEEIIQKTDISKGTLYNYFNDKEAILVAYFQGVITSRIDAVKELTKDNMDIEERLSGFIDFMSSVLKDDISLAVTYFKSRIRESGDTKPADSTHRVGMERWVLEIMEKAQNEGQLRKDISPRLLTRYFRFLVQSFLLSSIEEKEILQIDRIKKQILQLFLNGAKL